MLTKPGVRLSTTWYYLSKWKEALEVSPWSFVLLYSQWQQKKLRRNVQWLGLWTISPLSRLQLTIWFSCGGWNAAALALLLPELHAKTAAEWGTFLSPLFWHRQKTEQAKAASAKGHIYIPLSHPCSTSSKDSESVRETAEIRNRFSQTATLPFPTDAVKWKSPFCLFLSGFSLVCYLGVRSLNEGLLCTVL